MVAVASIRVVREALRLKRRAGELRDSQLFVALSNAEAESIHLQRSLVMLASQFQACKTAFDSIRESVAAVNALQLGAQFKRVRTEFAGLMNVLR